MSLLDLGRVERFRLFAHSRGAGVPDTSRRRLSGCGGGHGLVFATENRGAASLGAIAQEWSHWDYEAIDFCRESPCGVWRLDVGGDRVVLVFCWSRDLFDIREGCV